MFSLSLFLLTACTTVSSARQGGGQDFIITDTQQIRNLGSKERASLGRLISSLGGKDVDIAIIEEQEPVQQQRYGYPNHGRPLAKNNNSPEIEVFEIYTNESPYRNYYQDSGPPHRGPPLEHEPYPPPPRGGRFPRPHFPPGRYPPPPPFDDDDHSREHHQQHRKHHKQYRHRNRGHFRPPPPPHPFFEEDDPRREYDNHDRHHNRDEFDKTTGHPHEIPYHDTDSTNQHKDHAPHQDNINLSDPTRSPSHDTFKTDDDYDSDGDEDYNIAGYINDFPVILLKKNEIRK